MSGLVACLWCRFFWCLAVLGACTYIVFWKDQHGAWYILAVFLCSGDCKSYRSAEQIAADEE
jgi:hypothetical protein